MKIVKFHRLFVENHARARPDGYLAELRKLALGVEGDTWIFDADGDGYRAAANKYSNLPQPASPQLAVTTAATTTESPPPTIPTYSELWAALHRHAWGDDWDDPAWIDRNITAKLPCGECKQHWRALLAATPPDYSSREAFFAWGVAAHNQVNARLGKPIMGLDEARKIWRHD